MNAIFLLIVFVILPLNTKAAEDPKNGSSYLFPFSNPYSATFLSIIVHPTHLVFKDEQIILFPKRSDLELVGSRNRLKFTIATAKDPKAPLLFIFPGLGGSAYSGEALFLAEIAHDLGYSVVTLPSSTHWSFSLAASSNGRIGYLPADAEDMHKLLLAIRKKIKSKYQIHPSNYATIGYSYGALDSSFAAASDLEHKDFNFKKVIMINPPMDRDITTKKLDDIYTKGLNWSEHYREKLYTYIFGKMVLDMTAKKAMKIFQGRDMSWLKLSSTQLFWLISKDFRNILKNDIFISQQIEDLGIQDEAEAFNFANYLIQLVFPKVKLETGKTVDEIKEDCLVKTAANKVAKAMGADGRLYLFHNADDFLSFPEGRDQLINFPGQVKIYPTGGHVGNIWFPENVQDIKEALLF